MSVVADASALLPARYQMAFSLGWHIVIAAFGVALPTLLFVVHRKGLRGDADALLLAKRWSKVSGVLFALGAVSGTILSFEMGLLWPGLMGRFGDVLGLPFALEGVAFFVEAIFLGIYLSGWDRLPPRVHLFTLVPMMAAGVIGSFCVLAVNAWMNAPAGFRLDAAGRVVDVDPLAALFNPAVGLQWVHMWIGAYMVVGFVVAAVYAAGLRKGRDDRVHRLGFVIPFAFASVAAVAQPLAGHLVGARLNDHQPSKLAAIELNTTTRARAPLVLGGILVDGKVRYGLEVPVLGSLIARTDPNATLVGFDTVPEAGEVPATVVHLAFQTMVGLGFSLIGMAGWFWWRRRRGADLLASRRFLRLATLAGPAAVVALLSGWTVTEVGRQPWIVYRVLRVDEAVTDISWVWLSFTVVVAIYASMTVIGVKILTSMSRRWRTGGSDLPAPYGPERPLEAVRG